MSRSVTAKEQPIIALTSDFGLTDPYVGIVHGIMLSINPSAKIVDVTHAVPPQSIEAGAFALMIAVETFPPGTVHWCVVDPGVGTSRRGLIVQTDRGWFVGPDNGLVSYVLDHCPLLGCWVLDRPEIWRKPVSATFHGRDIFAPAAALLSTGVNVATLATASSTSPLRLEPMDSKPGHDGGVRGRVVWIDHFGNLITSISEHMVRSGIWLYAEAAGIRAPLVSTYEESAGVPVVALVGSGGFLELASFRGSSARMLGMGIGDPVSLAPADSGLAQSS